MTVAVNASWCCNCGRPIKIGDEIERDEEFPDDWGWSHARCAHNKQADRADEARQSDGADRG